MIELQARPLSSPVEDRRAKRSPYSASWSSVVLMLRGELAKIRARRVVVELAVQDSDVRNDGWVRSTARPVTSGVRLLFLCMYGDLCYECGTWARWEDNIYAVARTLRAQRMIARDGAVKGDQIYRGFRSLPGGAATTDRTDAVDEAFSIIGRVCGVTLTREAPPDSVRRQYLAACKIAHPDVTGGNSELMKDLNRARDVLALAGLCD